MRLQDIFAERLSYARSEFRKITVKTLGGKSKVWATTITAYETKGMIRPVKLADAVELAKALAVPLDYLFGIIDSIDGNIDRTEEHKVIYEKMTMLGSDNFEILQTMVEKMYNMDNRGITVNNKKKSRREEQDDLLKSEGFETVSEAETFAKLRSISQLIIES
jgi:transcriptional regulator with XRE-family HTH domain